MNTPSIYVEVRIFFTLVDPHNCSIKVFCDLLIANDKHIQNVGGKKIIRLSFVTVPFFLLIQIGTR